MKSVQTPIIPQTMEKQTIQKESTPKQIVNEVKKERKLIQKETLKNSAILTLGSVFFVIAAISFEFYKIKK